MHDLRDVGGTRGGLGTFLVGCALLIGGLYLLFDRVDVHGGYWGWGWGGRDGSFGVTLIPLLAGVAVLFWNGSSKLGWLLAGGGLVIILAGIISNMQIHFQRTSLTTTLIILALIAGGVGTIARSLRPSGGGPGAGDGAS